MGLLGGLALAPGEALAEAAEPTAAGSFWQDWGDGKAEVDGYALKLMRYGQPRTGSLVLIYVTEPLSDSLRVKADPGKHPPSDVAPVLKLNAVRKFQTGIYDYSTMTSVFVAVDNQAAGGGALRKVSFSSQEWCGQVFHQLLPSGPRLASTSHSYFDGEADDQRTLDWPSGALSEDELPIRLRSFRGQPDLLGPGKQLQLPLLRSLLRVRLLHIPLAFGQATLERLPTTTQQESPAGRFAVTTYTVTVSEPATAGQAPKVSDRAVYHVEAAAPYRLIHYRWDSGEEATLLGSRRIAYWQVNQNGQEALLHELGLQPQPGALLPTVPPSPLAKPPTTAKPPTAASRR